MITKDILGKYVTLRSATDEDADFALKIRQLPKALKYMPPLNISLAQQTEWIKKQRELEGDYFFFAWNKANERVGVLSVYDADFEKRRADVGRVVMKGKPFENLEAWLLLLEFSFKELNLREVVAYVNPDNTRAIRFYEFFGGVICEPSPNIIRSFPFVEAHFNAVNLREHKPAVTAKINSYG